MRARTDEAKDLRRQSILDAALDEFFEHGFMGARIDDIARRAGLSKGTVYLYFKSKEELFFDLVDAIATPKLEMVANLANTAPSATEAIRGILRFAPHLIRETPMPRILKILIGDSPRFPDVARVYRHRILDRVLGILCAILERGRAGGEFAIDHVELTARLVAAPIAMSAMWHILFETDPEAVVDLEALFAQHERILLKALTADGGGG